MASGSKKTRAKWTRDIERRLIDIWADIIEEFSGKMITRKKKEAIATTRLNAYLTEELGRTNVYTEKAICNKIDTILKNGKKMYATYQKKGETGKEYTEEDAEIDLEAAESSWPNFKTFHERFKDHPSLGPGAVDDSVTPTPSTIARSVAGDEPEVTGTATSTPDVSRPPSRSVVDSDSEEDEDDIPLPPSKKKKGDETPTVARVGQKKGKGTAATQFLLALSDMQEKAQERQMAHDAKMQEDAMKFQLKMEADRAKLEADISARLQQQNAQFRMDMMQQNQAFQAELLKKLFEKKDNQ